MIRLLSFLCMIFALAIFAAPAYAQDGVSGNVSAAPIGTLLEIEGEGNLIMRAAESGKAYPAQINDAVYPDDLLQTGPGAKMLVVMIDDSRFTLGENSRFKIDEYVYDDTSDVANAASYNVLQGVFLYTSGLIAKKANPDVKIMTGYGSIGIRGTTVWGGTIDDQYSVFVDDGEISFETNRGRIRVMAGEGTTIRNLNSIPERARIWGTEKINHAKAQITLKDTAKIKERLTAYKQKQPEIIARHKEFIRAKRQNKIEQQNPRDSIKRLDNKPQTEGPEKRAVKKQTMEQRSLPDGVRLNAPQKTEMQKPLEQGKDVVPPAFPRPEPGARPDPENLPSDPAKRQEELEKRNLKERGPAAVKRHDPL